MDDYSTGAYGTGAMAGGAEDGFGSIEGDSTSRLGSDIDLTQPVSTIAPEYGSEVQR